jgi:hypothetical protein
MIVADREALRGSLIGQFIQPGALGVSNHLI